MEENQRSTNKQARRSAELKMMEFYDSLERKVKRHRPEIFIPYMANLFRESLENFYRTKVPPHFILRSIEANCAFWKEGYDEQINRNRMAKIINLYIGYDNPVLINAIHTNLDITYLMMHREQIIVQTKPTSGFIARTWMLFVNNPSMKTIKKRFEDKYSLSIDDWFKLCYLCYAIAISDNYGWINIKSVESCSFIRIENESINPFLELTSITIDEIKEQFFDNIAKIPLEFHFLNKYIFLDRPIIHFSNQKLISPNPNFILLNAAEGLYKLASKLEGFDKSFGKSFQSYIEEILSYLENTISFIKSNKLENLTSGKSCDFLLEFENHILLIECKGTSLTTKVISENAILNNNSTSKIVEGMSQIYSTAQDLANGTLNSLGIDNNKIVIGVIVTFGDIPLVNTDWYHSIVMKRGENKIPQSLYPNVKIHGRPIIISVSTLESIINYLNSTDSSFIELYDEKASLPPYKGDWDAFIRSKTSELKDKIQQLHLVNEQINHFLISLGIPKEKL